MRRIGSERAVCRICEAILAAISAMAGVLGLIAMYRRIVTSEIAYYVATKASVRTINGVPQIVQFDQRVIPAPGFHLPSLLPFVGAVLLLSLAPIGAFYHALYFRGFGLVLLSVGVALLVAGLIAAVLAGTLLPMYVLIYGAIVLSPALAAGIIALAIGSYVEHFEEDRVPVA